MVLLSLVCMLGVAGSTAGLAYSTRLIVNDVFVAEDTNFAIYVAILVIAISIAKSVFTYANGIISVVFSRSISASYQKALYQAVLMKNMWHFIGKHSANQMAQIKRFGSASGGVVVSLVNKLLTETLTLIALIVVMILQDPIMTLVCGLLFPVVIFLVGNLTRRVRKIAQAEAEMEGAYFAIGAEAFDGIKTVRTYGLEGKIVKNFNAAIDTLEDRMLSIARITNATGPIMDVIGGLIIGSFVLYAAWQTITNDKTPGEFTAFITAFLLAYQPAERISKIWVEIQKNIIHVESMYKMMDTPTSVAEPHGGTELEGVPNSISFEDVTFQYGANKALDGLSFHVEPGEHIAIVGRSGAGKTTIIDLLLRFFDPTEGTVKIGGVDLSTVSQESIYKHFAFISQDVFLFDGTIRDNIRDGDPTASDEKIEEMAKRASLAEVLGDLPKGLDTTVGPNGRSLSGGQKQRVGIARALAKDASIFIFDEATSALDGDNERSIMQGIVSRLPDKTVIFITHREATLKYVDRVLHMKGGKLVGFDTYEALQANDPDFRSLFNLASDD
ncbi:MAG: ABC transporter ATP-binding protein [Yoonia sp.]|uniref:ABC transporter ATP-binding protein n=1 Tax=Yoonia sp. TaxID=2212373 RepID=UPI003EF554DE